MKCGCNGHNFEKERTKENKNEIFVRTLIIYSCFKLYFLDFLVFSLLGNSVKQRRNVIGFRLFNRVLGCFFKKNILAFNFLLKNLNRHEIDLRLFMFKEAG